MKVALVYDRVNKMGGAERILQSLHELYPDAPLYTLVYNKKNAKWADNFDIKTTFVQKIPFASTNHELFAWLAPMAFETFDFSEFDVVISVTSEAAKGVITKPETLHICYCLTPTRYLWSGYDSYFKKRFFRNITSQIVQYLRKWDLIAASRPDYFIAISQAVQKRIADYYKKESTVLYPSIPEFPKNIIDPAQQNYFLVVSRFVEYKRVDLAIKACNQLKLPLIVIGKGREEGKLKQIAGPTISFISDISDAELAGYYTNAKALVFPGVEDFGLVMAEALSLGTPVIAFNADGATEIVENGKTGILFNSQTVEAVKEALQKFDGKGYNRNYCREQAQKFTKKHFINAFSRKVDSLWKQHNQTFTHSS